MMVWQGYFLLPIGFALLALTYLLRVILGLMGSPRAGQPFIADIDEIQTEAER